MSVRTDETRIDVSCTGKKLQPWEPCLWAIWTIGHTAHVPGVEAESRRPQSRLWPQHPELSDPEPGTDGISMHLVTFSSVWCRAELSFDRWNDSLV